MSTAREFMTAHAECIDANANLMEAAQKMRDLDCGSLPICGEDKKLQGMITDRDIVIKVLAEGHDPRGVRAMDLAQGKPITVGADDSIETAVALMKEHKIRRLPVIEDHLLVGILSQGDIATHYDDETSVGQMVEEISR